MRMPCKRHLGENFFQKSQVGQLVSAARTSFKETGCQQTWGLNRLNWQKMEVLMLDCKILAFIKNHSMWDHVPQDKTSSLWISGKTGGVQLSTHKQRQYVASAICSILKIWSCTQVKCPRYVTVSCLPSILCWLYWACGSDKEPWQIMSNAGIAKTSAVLRHTHCNGHGKGPGRAARGKEQIQSVDVVSLFELFWTSCFECHHLRHRVYTPPLSTSCTPPIQPR